MLVHNSVLIKGILWKSCGKWLLFFYLTGLWKIITLVKTRCVKNVEMCISCPVFLVHRVIRCFSTGLLYLSFLTIFGMTPFLSVSIMDAVCAVHRGKVYKLKCISLWCASIEHLLLKLKQRLSIKMLHLSALAQRHKRKHLPLK